MLIKKITVRTFLHPKRVFLYMLMVLFSIVPASVWAEKIVVVLSRALLPYEQAWEGFKLNTSMKVEKLDMQGDAAKGEKIMSGISGDSVALVVTIGSEATMMAGKYLGAIPMVYTMVLEQPKITGKINRGVLMRVKLKKQLETLNKLFPDNKGIGVIYNLHYSGATINEARKITKALNAYLLPIAVENVSDIPSALKKITRKEIGVLWSIVDATVAKPEAVKMLIQHALKEKLPFLALSRYHVKAGALAALSVDYQDIGAQTAHLSKKMLADGTSQPAEEPRKLILFINKETQKKMDIGNLPELKGIQVIAK
ncbi:hypothetical protein KAR34_09520 [bacterium]|nr:hypothetical protein [bacterium]